MTFFTIGQSEGGSEGGSKSEEGVAESHLPGNNGHPEIKMYIDAFYTSDFLHGYFK